MPSTGSTQDTDLFGNPVTPAATPAPTKPRPQTNDMDLIERVLKVACLDGYAVVGTAERVYRVGTSDRTGVTEVVSVPADEANAVHQLIDTKYLVVGGSHRYRYRNYREGYGRAVLVPRTTRARQALWSHLHRPTTWETKTNT